MQSRSNHASPTRPRTAKDGSGRGTPPGCRQAAASIAVLLAIATAGSGAAAQQFGAESFTLANGLQVVVLPTHRAPAITEMVWYKTGAADDPRGKSGIAHFLEHLMFKGTPAHPLGAFSALIAQG